MQIIIPRVGGGDCEAGGRGEGRQGRYQGEREEAASAPAAALPRGRLPRTLESETQEVRDLPQDPCLRATRALLIVARGQDGFVSGRARIAAEDFQGDGIGGTLGVVVLSYSVTEWDNLTRCLSGRGIKGLGTGFAVVRV